jgi:toxin CcdB
MPQFDVYTSADGTLLLDCQSEALAHLDTRLAAPLLLVEKAPAPRLRLNPVFEINGELHVLVTQFAATVRSNQLRNKIASLDRSRFDIIGAFDMLLTGV